MTLLLYFDIDFNFYPIKRQSPTLFIVEFDIYVINDNDLWMAVSNHGVTEAIEWI